MLFSQRKLKWFGEVIANIQLHNVSCCYIIIFYEEKKRKKSITKVNGTGYIVFQNL